MRTSMKCGLAAGLLLVAVTFPFVAESAFAAYPMCISSLNPGEGEEECLDCCDQGWEECGGMQDPGCDPDHFDCSTDCDDAFPDV